MTTLTDDEMRVRIAEACKLDLWVIVKQGLYYRPNAGGYTASITEAWKLPKAEAQKYEMYADRSDVPYCEKVLIEPAPHPDFLTSLDAMAQAEATLAGKEREQYAGNLWGALVGSSDLEKGTVYEDDLFRVLHASARQRALAFLETINQRKT